MKNQNKKRIAVALSGGLDSSVTCYLLQKQGYEVVAITVKMLDNKDFEEVVNNAKAVAEKLSIEHHVIDLSEDFKKHVIDYFEEAYANGKTPNPCILCNQKIKWGKLLEYAINELKCDFMATGHYANIKRKNGEFLLYPATDAKKDQLYYLMGLSQEHLSKTIFPLNQYTKDEIRQIAIENDLPTKSAKESQDICFIKKPMTTKKYLHEKFNFKKGEFILKSTGKKIGEHNGFFEYTVGQRKGIGIAYKEPLYVLGVEKEGNKVYLGTKEELFEKTCRVKNVNYQVKCEDGTIVMAKIRYNTEAKKAVLNKEEDGFSLIFETPVSAVAKGQACVVYDIEEGFLIAGGEIL